MFFITAYPTNFDGSRKNSHSMWRSFSPIDRESALPVQTAHRITTRLMKSGGKLPIKKEFSSASQSMTRVVRPWPLSWPLHFGIIITGKSRAFYAPPLILRLYQVRLLPGNLDRLVIQIF